MILDLHKLPAADQVGPQPIQSSFRNAELDVEPIQQDTMANSVESHRDVESYDGSDLFSIASGVGAVKQFDQCRLRGMTCSVSRL